MPEVSIIIPIYNAAAYMNDCIASIMKQTVQDFEVILIDDGSLDNSYQLAVEWTKKYPGRIRAYTQENAGQGDARNKGVLYAKGSYIMFADSDDTVSDKFVEEAYQTIKKLDADMAIFDAVVVDENGKKLQDMKGCQSEETEITLESFPRLLLEFPCPWNKIYKKKLFTENRLQYPTHMWYEDLAGASMFYTKAWRIAILHKPLYYYMQRTDSVMHSKVSQKNMEILKAVDIILEYYKEQGLYVKFYQELEYLGIYHILIAAAGRTIRGDSKSQFAKQFMEYMDYHFPNWEQNIYIKELSKANRLKLWLLRKKYYRILHVLYKIGKTNTI